MNIYTILNNYLDYLDKQIPIILICIQNEISINTIEILAENKFSYGFEEKKDSYLSVAGTTNKNINNVNWVSFREHFFSSIII